MFWNQQLQRAELLCNRQERLRRAKRLQGQRLASGQPRRMLFQGRSDTPRRREEIEKRPSKVSFRPECHRSARRVTSARRRCKEDEYDATSTRCVSISLSGYHAICWPRRLCCSRLKQVPRSRGE